MKNYSHFSIDLNDKELAILAASIIEMHHALVRSTQYEHLEKENKEKVTLLRKIWEELCEQCNIL